jgi:hypothetical protein
MLLPDEVKGQRQIRLRINPFGKRVNEMNSMALDNIQIISNGEIAAQ